MEIGVFILFGLVALAGAYAAYYFRKKRREELAAMAFRLGLEFSSDDPFGCLTYPFALLTKGDGRGTENVMWGTWQNMAVREFDYWYYEESTDSNGNRSRTYHRFSCAVTEIDAACSHLTIDRENLFTALADHIGLHDIEFESDDFNRAFNVKSKDRKFASDIVDARMMQWLRQTDGGVHFEACGTWLLAFGKKRRPDDLIPLLGTLQQFRDHVPRVVYELYPVA
jgi:LPXTG-motif cell wall-anchored protein